MLFAPSQAERPGRAAVLHELRLLRTPREAAFDALAALLLGQLQCQSTAMLLLDADGPWTKAAAGTSLSAQLEPLTPWLHQVADMPAGTSAPAGSVDPFSHQLAAHPLSVDGVAVGVLFAVGPAIGPWPCDPLPVLAQVATVANALLADRLHLRQVRRDAARLRTASLSSSDWLWETDADGRVTWVSDSIEQHTGLPAHTNVGRTVDDIASPSNADSARSWDRFRTQRAAHEPFRDLVAERSTPRGPLVTSISGVPVFDEHGAFKGYRGATTNITERVRAEQAAQVAERQLADALETMVAAVMITDADGRILRSNAAWRNSVGPLPGVDPLHWPSMVAAMVHAGDYPDAVGSEAQFIAWRLGIASELGLQHEMRWRDRWKLVSARRLPHGDVVHLAIDITDRKNAELALAARERELRESQHHLQAVLEAVPDLWFVLDAEGRFLECSSAEHPMLAHEWSQLRGRPVGERLPAQLATAAQNSVAQALSTRQVQRHEYTLRTRDGIGRSFEARVSPMPDGRVLYVSRDLTDLRTLERDLRLMKRAVEAAAVPMCVCDVKAPDMPLVYVNPAFEALTGYTQAELLGRNCRVLQGSLPVQGAVADLRDAIAGARDCSVQLTNVRKDGTAFTNALRVAPVFDAQGALTHYIGVLHDVTAQALAAEKLRLSEELYRSVASAISDGLMVVAHDLTLIAINPAGAAILGVTPGEVVAAPGPWPFELLTADALPLDADTHPVHQVVRTGTPVASQVHALRRADGQLRWLELTARPLQVRPSGSTFSAVLTFRDVTQQRAAEQALVAAEERWQFALDGSGDGVWDWDAEADRVFFSPGWKRMLGHEEHEIGNTLDEWTSRIHPDDLPRVTTVLQHHLRGQTATYQNEHRMRHRDGHDVWILDRGKVVRHDADGHPLRVVGTHSDITRVKQAEQALRDKQAAELASAAKSQFLSRMSHEMRTPLNAVIGFAQLMRMAPGAEGHAELGGYADHVLTAGQHLLALINDVLDLQKVEEGALALSIAPVPLDECVQHALELLGPAAGARQVRVVNRVQPPCWVRADAQRLRQVVLNIVSNAVKYNVPGGTVTLTVGSSEAGWHSFTVEDTGPGLTEEQLARLFQPFERLGMETSSTEGTGLGLIISRSLTQAIGGRLAVESAPGSGTRVRIDLPQESPPESHRPLAIPAEVQAPPQPDADPRIRMLYVEDNRINAILFEGALRLQADTVELRVAEDGEEALALVKHWCPDVLVLDAHLPGMSGFDVLRHLREVPGLAVAPAYMCSADAMPEDVQRAKDAGFLGYWTKPLNIRAVLSDIAALVTRFREERRGPEARQGMPPAG